MQFRELSYLIVARVGVRGRFLLLRQYEHPAIVCWRERRAPGRDRTPNL